MPRPTPALLAALGALLWALWAATLAAGVPQSLLLLGALVVVPLGLAADRAPAATPARALAVAGMLPAALLLLLASHLRVGLLAGLLALPWLAVTLLLATEGLSRLSRRFRSSATELCIDAAYVFVAVGGGWAALDWLGARPLGYDPLIVLFTAVHFHFAGFALPLLAGLLGRARPRGTPPLLAAGILLGVPLVAVGLILSQITGWTGGEWLASWTLAFAGLALGVLQIREGLRPTGALAPGALLVASGLSIGGGMFMAAAYGLSRAWGFAWPGIDDMIWLHGVLNAVGFALPGLLARALEPPAHLPAPLPPILQRGLAGDVVIGNGWFEQAGMVDPEAAPPEGQVDRLEDLAWGGFHPRRVRPAVRDFYERTRHHELWVRPRWRPLLALPGRLYVALAGRVGQLVLPLDQGGAWQQVRAEVFALRQPPAPGLRPDTRLYERRYADGRPMFIAAYGTARLDDRAYMCVALPLPLSSLVSVMRLEDLPEGGLRIRSQPFDARGAEGIFWDTPLGALRLPLQEDLLLGPAEEGFAPGPDPAVPGATVAAVHRFTLLGVRVLELDYLIRPIPSPPQPAEDPEVP